MLHAASSALSRATVPAVWQNMQPVSAVTFVNICEQQQSEVRCDLI